MARIERSDDATPVASSRRSPVSDETPDFLAPFDEFDDRDKRAWLAAYAETGNMTAAARAADVARTLPYYWQEVDERFVQAMREAAEIAADDLELEARRRAKEGTRKVTPIWRNVPRQFGERIVLVPELVGEVEEITYSDTLLIFLLKALRPERYRDNSQGVGQQAEVVHVEGPGIEHI
jgi:hypothetical protein